MKPISEYNFREIVGHFVMLRGVSINPNYEEYLAYCYIDQEKGISFRILGMYGLEDSKVIINEVIILRYNENIQLEIFNCPEDSFSLLEIAKEINYNYSNETIDAIRNILKYDPYRNNIFPDDLFLLTFVCTDNEIKAEPLWIRPFEKMDENIYGKTIEQGINTPEGTQVAIIDRELFFKDPKENVPSVFAVTFDALEKLLEEENFQNEVQKEE